MTIQARHASRLRSLLASLLAGLLAGPAASAQPAGDWQVELVVFTWREPPATTEFVLEPAPPAPLSPVLLPLLPVPGSDGEAAQPLTRYPLLDDEALLLRTVRQRLARTGELRPLLHLGWRQNAAAARVAQPQVLPVPGDGEGLSGTVRLYRRQSLHVELDLRLPDESGLYRLRETRIVRSGELSYFDHPRLGALVRVTPAADPAVTGPLSVD